jgi:chromosomal replication initiator protein
MRAPASTPHLPASLVLAVTAARFGVPSSELISHRHLHRLAPARAFAVWMLRALGTPASYPEIGKALGGRDHSSIINLHRKAIRLRLEDRAFAEACDHLSIRFNELREISHAFAS